MNSQRIKKKDDILIRLKAIFIIIIFETYNYNLHIKYYVIDYNVFKTTTNYYSTNAFVNCFDPKLKYKFYHFNKKINYKI